MHPVGSRNIFVQWTQGKSIATIFFLNQKSLVVPYHWHERDPSASSCPAKGATTGSYPEGCFAMNNQEPALLEILFWRRRRVVSGGIVLLSPRTRNVLCPAAGASLHGALLVVMNTGLMFSALQTLCRERARR